MKFRYYLRGAGVGIIVTTVILMIAMGKPSMTAEQIIAEAKKLGMVMAEDKHNGYVKDETDSEEQNKDNGEESGSDNSMEQQKPNGESGNEDGLQNGESDKGDSESNSDEQNDQNDTSGQRKMVTLTVSSGDTSEVVSEKLLALGVIKDKDDFNKWLCVTKGLGDKIMCGTFEIPQDASYEEIVSIIIK